MPLLVVTLLPSGRQVSPDVELDATVDMLRQEINDLAGDGNSAPPEMQLLVFGETVLEDGHALREYGLALESELRRSWPKPIWVSLNVGGLCVHTPLDTLEALLATRWAPRWLSVKEFGVDFGYTVNKMSKQQWESLPAALRESKIACNHQISSRAMRRRRGSRRGSLTQKDIRMRIL